MDGLFNSLGNWVLEGNTHFWFWLCLLVYWRVKSVFCSLCRIPPCHSELLGKSTGFLEVDRSRVLPVGVTHWAGQSLGLKGTLEEHQQQVCCSRPAPVHSSAGAGWESLSWRTHPGFQSNPRSICFTEITLKSIFARDHLFCIKQRDTGDSLYGFLQNGSLCSSFNSAHSIVPRKLGTARLSSLEW